MLSDANSECYRPPASLFLDFKKVLNLLAHKFLSVTNPEVVEMPREIFRNKIQNSACTDITQFLVPLFEKVSFYFFTHLFLRIQAYVKLRLHHHSFCQSESLVEVSVEQYFSPSILSNLAERFAVTVEKKPIGDFENYVFSATTPDGAKRVLRVTHSSHRTKEQIEEEMGFLDHLAKNAVSVARPYMSRAGSFVEAIEVENGSFFGSLFEFVPGEHVKPGDAAWNEQLFFAWGKAIGRMHALAVDYPQARHRLQWLDDEAWIHKEIDAELKCHAAEIFGAVELLLRDRTSFGLIHSDVHQGNFFYDGTAVHIFDFDDLNYHFFIHDLAMVIYYAFLNRYALPADEKTNLAQFHLKHLRRGYETEFHLDETWYATIPLFLRLRDVLLYCNFKKKLDGKEISPRLQTLIQSIRERIGKEEPIVRL